MTLNAVLDSDDVARHIAPETRRLLRIVERNRPDVKFRLKGKGDAAGSVSMVFGRNIVSLFNPYTSRPGQFEGKPEAATGSLNRTLAHEAIHTIFSAPEITGMNGPSRERRIVDQMAKGILAKTPKQFQDSESNQTKKKEVEAEYKYLVKQVKDIYKQAAGNGKLQGYYGISSPGEFVAQALASPEFRAALKEVPYKATDALSVVLLNVRKMLAAHGGLTQAEAGSLLAAIDPTLDRLLDN